MSQLNEISGKRSTSLGQGKIGSEIKSWVGPINRRGVSIMVGYVLLIAIAVSLSTAVFFYLKLYLPDERPECDADIKLTIDSATCVDRGSFIEIDLEVTNRGLFKADGAYIKIGDYDRAYREELNYPDEGLSFVSTCNPDPNGVLNPSDTFCKEYTYDPVPTEPQELSVQPIIWVDNQPILCSDAVVTKKIVCT